MATTRKFVQKVGTVAGATAAAAVNPIAVDAKIVQNPQVLRVSMADFFAGNGTVPWDVDGNGSADFDLVAGRGSALIAYGCNYHLGICRGSYYVRFAVGINPYPNSNNGVLVGVQHPVWREYLAAPVDPKNSIGPTMSDYQFRPYGHRGGPPWGVVNVAAGYYTSDRVRLAGPGVTSPTYYVHKFGAGIPAGDSFVGFKFDIAGNAHYGWAEISFGNDPELSLQINGWAYRAEPGESIEAGQVPVPSSGIAALTLLGLGAAGMRGWRRRRA